MTETVKEILLKTRLSREDLASRLDVSLTSVHQWSHYNKLPRKHWQKIIDISQGRVTWEMLENFGGTPHKESERA